MASQEEEKALAPINEFQTKLASHLGYGITPDDLNQQNVAIRGCTESQSKWNTFIKRMQHQQKLTMDNPAQYVLNKKASFYKIHCKDKEVQKEEQKPTWKVVKFDKSCQDRDLDKRTVNDAEKLKDEIDKLETDKGIEEAFDEVDGLTYKGKHAYETQDKRVGRELKPAGGGDHGRIFVGYNTDKKEVYMECVKGHLQTSYIEKARRIRDKAMAQSIDYGDYDFSGSHNNYGNYENDYVTDAQNGYIGHYEYLPPQKYLHDNNSINFDYLLFIPALIIGVCCCIMIWFICCGIGGSAVYIVTRKSAKDEPRVAHYDEESLK